MATTCTCRPLYIGLKAAGTKELDPDCPEHGDVDPQGWIAEFAAIDYAQREQWEQECAESDIGSSEDEKEGPTGVPESPSN